MHSEQLRLLLVGVVEKYGKMTMNQKRAIRVFLPKALALKRTRLGSWSETSCCVRGCGSPWRELRWLLLGLWHFVRLQAKSERFWPVVQCLHVFLISLLGEISVMLILSETVLHSKLCVFKLHCKKDMNMSIQVK